MESLEKWDNELYSKFEPCQECLGMGEQRETKEQLHLQDFYLLLVYFLLCQQGFSRSIHAGESRWQDSQLWEGAVLPHLWLTFHIPLPTKLNLQWWTHLLARCQFLSPTSLFVKITKTKQNHNFVILPVLFLALIKSSHLLGYSIVLFQVGSLYFFHNACRKYDNSYITGTLQLLLTHWLLIPSYQSSVLF